MTTKQVTRSEVEGLIERIATKSYLYGEDIDSRLYSLSEVFIGDVLNKMKVQDILYSNAPYPRSGDNSGWILDYWSKCGFTKSLQDIVSESGWKILIDGENREVQQELKSPEANALFSFLLQIGL